jgi:hypothetical protein
VGETKGEARGLGNVGDTEKRNTAGERKKRDREIGRFPRLVYLWDSLNLRSKITKQAQK